MNKRHKMQHKAEVELDRLEKVCPHTESKSKYDKFTVQEIKYLIKFYKAILIDNRKSARRYFDLMYNYYYHVYKNDKKDRNIYVNITDFIPTIIFNDFIR